MMAARFGEKRGKPTESVRRPLGQGAVDGYAVPSRPSPQLIGDGGVQHDGLVGEEEVAEHVLFQLSHPFEHVGHH